MAMSSAERQARFRERRKAQGLKRRDAWQDAADFLPAEGEETQTRPRTDYNQFLKELKALVKPIPELEAEEIYAMPGSSGKAGTGSTPRSGASLTGKRSGGNGDVTGNGCPFR